MCAVFLSAFYLLLVLCFLWSGIEVVSYIAGAMYTNEYFIDASNHLWSWDQLTLNALFTLRGTLACPIVNVHCIPEGHGRDMFIIIMSD